MGEVISFAERAPRHRARRAAVQIVPLTAGFDLGWASILLSFEIAIETAQAFLRAFAPQGARRR